MDAVRGERPDAEHRLPGRDPRVAVEVEASFGRLQWAEASPDGPEAGAFDLCGEEALVEVCGFQDGSVAVAAVGEDSVGDGGAGEGEQCGARQTAAVHKGVGFLPGGGGQAGIGLFTRRERWWWTVAPVRARWCSWAKAAL
ncbi:hypothetical protein GCM10009540_85310 [Streptomyces turgidiscabies]